MTDLCINFHDGKCKGKRVHCPWFRRGECTVNGHCGQQGKITDRIAGYEVPISERYIWQ